MAHTDTTFINLEKPIIENCPRGTTGFTFCAPPTLLSGLTFSGVDLVSLANNHTLNYGKAGFVETKKHLGDKAIGYVGDNNLETFQVGDVKLGFLGFEKSQQVSPKLTETEKNLISESNAKVDILIVSMHWGVEYQDKALPGVTNLAHEIVDLGADVIVGHHPHWVQNIENYNGVPIYYSLGNLVFDQMWSERTREGLLVKLTFEGDKIVKEEFVKTYMEDRAQPVIITGN